MLLSLHLPWDIALLSSNEISSRRLLKTSVLPLVGAKSVTLVVFLPKILCSRDIEHVSANEQVPLADNVPINLSFPGENSMISLKPLDVTGDPQDASP